MTLINYTTRIASKKTVGEMQDMLAQAGADAVAIHYVDGAAYGLTFTLSTQYGQDTFTLKVEADKVAKVLAKTKAASMSQREFYSNEHAERVAWRVAKHWLEAQLAMVKIGLVSLDQVMLPYLHVDSAGTTLAAAYDVNRGRLRQLTGGTD
jgi:hypothetical protein